MIYRYMSKIVFCGLITVLIMYSATNAGSSKLNKEDIAAIITSNAKENRFPNRLSIADIDNARVQYTFSSSLHQDMANVYLKYQPDYACFVAIDVETGAILNLTSFVKSDEQWDNLVLRAAYPAASVFKLITAAAAIDLNEVTPETIIPFNGKSTTLYKNQVFKHKKNKWTRTPTFKESFAKSINPVFARIGAQQLGASKLTDYAARFGFGTPLQTDFILPTSNINLDLGTEWALAEAASGYTRDITLSPIHAAQMAATVANGGRLVTPYMVDTISSDSGEVLYQAEPSVDGAQVISLESANKLRSLMQETVRIGSARGSFNDIKRYKVYRDMEIGGKTGSLTGLSPKGRHDWFVGYADKNGRKIAYASLIVNKEKWYVRSAYVARQFIYHYFTEMDAKLESSEITAVGN